MIVWDPKLINRTDAPSTNGRATASSVYTLEIINERLSKLVGRTDEKGASERAYLTALRLRKFGV